MTEYLQRHRKTLLQLVRASIQHGLSHDRPLEVSLDDYDDTLLQHSATFVTLHKQGRLRGCIGQLIANRPLVVDIAMNAYAAAFQDPRFPPLSANEYPDLTVDISILSQPELMNVHSDEELLAQIKPGHDGLIIEKGVKRGTFLPSVWEQLPDPRDFLQHLKRKAGLSEDDQSPDIVYYRYTTLCLSED